DGNWPADDAFDFLRFRPRLPRQRDDPAVRVDDRGHSHVHGPDHAPPRLDRPEPRNGQVLLVLRGPLEPAVVGNVDYKIVPRGPRPDVLPGQRRVRVLVADHAGEVVGAFANSERESRPLLPGLAAVVPVVWR